MCVVKKLIRRKRNEFLCDSKAFACSVKDGIKITISTNIYYRNHYLQYAQAKMIWHFTFFIVTDRFFGFHPFLIFLSYCFKLQQCALLNHSYFFFSFAHKLIFHYHDSIIYLVNIIYSFRFFSTKYLVHLDMSHKPDSD